MVALIEEQMTAALQAEEDEKAKLARRKPRKIETPWTRGAHPQLCQETDLLLLVSEYDYDLEDAAFQAYCRSRGVLHVAGAPGSERWGIFGDGRVGKEAYLGNPYFQNSQMSKEYTPEQMETQWEIIRIGRAKLQDCWELLHQRGDL